MHPDFQCMFQKTPTKNYLTIFGLDSTNIVGLSRYSVDN